MKIFHTADWHLGKLVQGFYMTDDQREVMQQFIKAVEEERPDAIIIAGDLYDRAVPPVDAVNLYDELLTTLAYDLQTPVLVIAGNHDSPGRLQFGRTFMQTNRYYVTGHLADAMEPIVLHDDDGPVHFYLIPYVDPSIVRVTFDDESVRSHDDAMRVIVEQIKRQMDSSVRNVLVAHAFVTASGKADDTKTSDSERPLAIGGAEYVKSTHFDAFDYVALGHLHQAHRVGSDHIRYAGSPLKYSLSEQHHKKGFYAVTLDRDGELTVEQRRLYPKRDVRSIEGTLENILAMKPSEDYVFVTLLDEEPVLRPMERVRAVFPNAMHVERRLIVNQEMEDWETIRQTKRATDSELFAAFYKNIRGDVPSHEALRIFEEALRATEEEEQE